MEGNKEEDCCICLEPFEDVATLDSCKHRFCFKCISEWSKNKPVCPYCKIEFKSVVHYVDGNEVSVPVRDDEFSGFSSDFNSDIELLEYVVVAPEFFFSMRLLPRARI